MPEVHGISSVHYHTPMVSQTAALGHTVSMMPNVNEHDNNVSLYPSILSTSQTTTATPAPRSHSPPPAYSEIDQHPQPAPQAGPATPQEHRKQTRGGTKLAAGKGDSVTNKKKSAQKPATKTSQNTVQQTKGNPSPQRVEEQRHVRNTAVKSEGTSTPVRDHNGVNKDRKTNGSHENKRLSGSPATRRVAPLPPTTASVKSSGADPDYPGFESQAEDDQATETSRGPITPPRRLPGEPQGLPFKCVKRFACHSETIKQSGGFQKPTRVSVSKLGEYMVITDTEEMTVQTFTYNGEYVYKFKALGVQGACMWAKEKLAVATHHGVDVCTIGGYKEVEIPVGCCINTVPYRYGFIAVRTKTLLFFNNNAHQTRELLKKKHKASPFKKYTSFEQIKDVAVSTTKDIAVLESSGDVYVIDEDGLVKYAIQSENESCGRIIDPYSVVFDRWSNIFVTDLASRKVLRFSPNGKFSRFVLNFNLGEVGKNRDALEPYGISANCEADHLVVIISGKNTAEVRIYKLY